MYRIEQACTSHPLVSIGWSICAHTEQKASKRRFEYFIRIAPDYRWLFLAFLMSGRNGCVMRHLFRTLRCATRRAVEPSSRVESSTKGGKQKQHAPDTGKFGLQCTHMFLFTFECAQIDVKHNSWINFVGPRNKYIPKCVLRTRYTYK